MGVRKLTPGGYEYLTGSVACGDRELEPGEALSDYYTAHGYPPGQWFGRGAELLEMSGEVTAAQMQALFGEGRHPDADRIETDLINAGASPEEALKSTKLGSQFPRYGLHDELRSKVIAAYKAHNVAHDRPVGAPIDDETRAGIRRNVQAEAFADAHEGAHPTETELDRWLAEQKRPLKSAVAGYEFVIAPPKSVSVAWALSNAETRELIVGLHRQAVRDALQYFEDNAAFTRKGTGGLTQHDVHGITAATFEHWDSRAGDPHLHTHVPISTKVQGPDGRWTSLDGRTLFAAAVTVSEYYDSRLRDLFREHGARWSLQPGGGFDLKRMGLELDGVPADLVAGFSQRASQVEQDRAKRIVAFRRDHRREPTPKELREISRQAKYGTRDAKRAPQSLADHVRRWRAQAATMVASDVLTGLRQRVFGGTAEPTAHVDVAALAARTREVVSDYYSHFNTWNVAGEAHRQTAHLRVADRDDLIDHIVHTALHDPDTIRLTAPSLVDYSAAELHRANGESVFTEHNAQRFTTHRTLREEAALAAWGQRRDGCTVSRDAVTRALAGERANPGQRQAVAEFALSGRRVQLLLAPAGSGKTTTMRIFADAWRAEGGRVFAFGSSARAAEELGKSIASTPHTLHQVTHALTTGVAKRRFPFQRGDVLIIDEVGMAGTHTLHDVVAYALARGADVRLVGDDKQLSAVEAGGAVRWFQQNNGAIQLREVVRFADRGQADASLNLRAGSAEGLDYYEARGWIQGGSRETMRAAAHQAWRADLDQGRQSLLIVPSNEDVVALNLQARELRAQRGYISPEKTVRLHDGTQASVGDWVVTRQNDRLTTLFSGRDFVKNGDTWDVQKIRRDGSLAVCHRVSGGRIVLPAQYVQRHVELAYASTVNRVQGMNSTGSSHSLVPQGLSREQLYTQITRAVHDNRLYVETLQHTADSHQETPLELTTRGALEAVLARSSAEISATEELHRSLAAAESLSTLVAEHNYIAGHGVGEQIEDVLTAHAPDLLDLPAAAALRQTVRNAIDLGWQAEYLIPRALAWGPWEESDDAAAVLQWRITQYLVSEQPPPRRAAPTAEQVAHWQELTAQAAPDAAVTGKQWHVVWQHAAAAARESLDADAAITAAAHALAARPHTDPMPEHDYVAEIVTTRLNQQHAAEDTLPWLAHPNHAALTPELRVDLHRVQDAIARRVVELRAAATTNPPRWTAALGQRPNAHVAAAHWDRLVGLAAAFRDTFGITGDDPHRPLGSKPDDQDLRSRAWTMITDLWATPHATQRNTTAEDASDYLHASLDADQLLAALTETDAGSTRHEESLSITVQRHSRVSRALLEAAARQAVASHAPQALDTPAEDALMRILRQAQRSGWQADRLVRQAVRQSRPLDDVDAPAAVLGWRIAQRIDNHPPPAPVAEPTEDQVHRWQALAVQAAGQEAIKDPTWQLVWWHAAAGALEGLDADAAITRAVHALVARPAANPVDSAQNTAELVVHLLSQQREQHSSESPVLPWMDRPHPTVQAADPRLADHLHQQETAAHARFREIRASVTTQPPLWAAALDPRPTHDVGAGEDWDELVSTTAAYRETYGIHTTNPATPLGVEPSGDNPQATAWRLITDQWNRIAALTHAPHGDDAAEHDNLHEYYDDELTEDTTVHSGMTGLSS